MLEFFKRVVELPKKYPVFSILAVTVGILLLTVGEGGAALMALALGALLLILSALRIAGVFILGERGLGSTMTLALHIGVILFAVSLIASPAEGYSQASLLSGVYLSLSGVWGLFSLCLYRSPTYLALTGKAPLSHAMLGIISALYVLALSAGVYLLYFTEGNSSNVPAGIALTVSGICLTVASLIRSRGAGKGGAPTAEKGYIEAEFEDKTGK